MNKVRRAWLSDVVNRLTVLQDELESIASEEQDAYDNLPEGIQCSERGNDMEDNISTIEDAASDLEDLIEQLQDVIDK